MIYHYFKFFDDVGNIVAEGHIPLEEGFPRDDVAVLREVGFAMAKDGRATRWEWSE